MRIRPNSMYPSLRPRTILLTPILYTSIPFFASFLPSFSASQSPHSTHPPPRCSAPRSPARRRQAAMRPVRRVGVHAAQRSAARGNAPCVLGGFNSPLACPSSAIMFPLRFSCTRSSSSPDVAPCPARPGASPWCTQMTICGVDVTVPRCGDPRA